MKRAVFSPRMIILMTVFIDVTGFGIVLPLLPYYASEFGAGSTALGFLVASFALMQFIFTPILGRLSDNMGRRPILLLSILTSVGSFLLFAVADSYLILLLSRIVAGLATELGVAQAYISDITSLKDRTVGMGRIGAAHGAGFIIGPAIGGFLSTYNYSTAGFVAAALAMVNLVFAFLFLPESRHSDLSRDESSDGTGRITGIRRFLSSPTIGLLVIILFIMSIAFSAFPVIMPLLAISLFGLSSSDMSLFFVYIGVVQIVFQGFIVGRLAARLGEAQLVPIGALLMTLGVFFMAIFPNLPLFLMLSTIMVSGIGILSTTIPSFISKRTATHEQGQILGVTQSISSIARVPGPVIGGFFYEFAGVQAPFFLSATLLLLATLIGIKIARNNRHSDQ
ncbi:MAG: MFS transporter [Candidatus Bathyarchaeota archaeon]|nr:MFS transporter [Candidatus Bathyarchaeota archaeon]